MKQTTLCYVERNQEYLMLYRNAKKQDPNGGKWIGVGGKLEPAETPEQCLLREVLEETGLTLTAYQYRGVIDFCSDTWPDEQMHLYTATGFTGSLQPCNEGELAWVPKDQVPTLALWQGDRIFLQLLNQGHPFFHLSLQYRGDALVAAMLDGTPLAL